MNIPRVSVVVPVYNSESYISRCCHSLFQQTLEDVEYIFVDDCSTDNSVSVIKEVLKEYPERNELVKIVRHSPNRGVSFTREQGMSEATGEFIIHCDSDDWIERNMYEAMYETAIKTKSDIVCCGYFVDYSNGMRRQVAYGSKDFFANPFFFISPKTGSLWNKLIRRNLLLSNDIHFPDSINWGEDFCVSISSLISSCRTICIPDVFYHYQQNSASITHSVTTERCMELVGCGSYVENFLKRTGKLPDYAFQLNFLKFQVSSVFLCDKNNRDIARWLATYPECHASIWDYPTALYLKLTAFFASHHLSVVANLLLLARDLYLKIRK